MTLFMATEVKDGIVKTARVTVGALSPKPFRALAAEKVLSGVKLSARVIDEAALELERDLDGARASGFKKEAASSLFKRFFSGI